MQSFDVSLLMWLNTFAKRSTAVDTFIVLLVATSLVKGGMVMAALWWGWFRSEDDPLQRRQAILATLVGCLVALVVARALAVVLPFRARPLHTPELAFLLPYGMNPRTLINWSAFPSDHAALFAGLATGMYALSRRLGWVALGYVVTVICLPRLYLGIHYPTDLLAGALIGMVSVSLAQRPWITPSGADMAGESARLFLCVFLPAQLRNGGHV
jgi:undecaprenyl-diphosphatase